jgi:hypothetical protein
MPRWFDRLSLFYAPVVSGTSARAGTHRTAAANKNVVILIKVEAAPGRCG